ncbi:hypothetical protein J4G48_0029735 [Bradyrhizobium barranii subsp. apii]|uniref:hypothetical protein n=1 Tax=Bradyrhizobium barranii TaxID=2992140 RepID=UPI001AA10F01|nr:hypothetical protein [Bradyrhizobium barranii]UPT93530.1 hypothetical protein J4G48_0029735 [Bradyrhizobium barranii subsp. apii]
MADGTDGADAFSGLVAYARAWGVEQKNASAPSAASGLVTSHGESNRAEFPSARDDEGTHHRGFTQVPITVRIEMRTTDSQILIEMPGVYDCSFVGSWLLTVAQAQSLWSEELHDRVFQTSASTLSPWFDPFQRAALEVLSAAPFSSHETNPFLLVELDATGVFSTAFAMMVHLGFFVSDGGIYRLAVPDSITIHKVTRAASKVASSEMESLLHILPHRTEAARLMRGY